MMRSVRSSIVAAAQSPVADQPHCEEADGAGER